MRKLGLAGFSMAIALAGCGETTPQAHNIDENLCGSNEIVVSDAWVREARAGQNVTGAFLMLCNGTDSDDAFVGASFAGANAAELHQTTIGDDGTTQMAPTDSISLPKGSMVALKSGGAHLMLIGLSAPIGEGDDPAVELIFENADPVTVIFDVRTIGEAENHSQH